MAPLKLAVNNFHTRRVYVYKKCGCVCSNFGERFPSKNFFQDLSLLM